MNTDQPQKRQQLQPQPGGQQMRVGLNPEKMPVLFTDGVGVNANDAGITINFLQSAVPLPLQQVVSRIGMSHAQAKMLYDQLGNLLKEYYKQKGIEW